MMPPVRSRHFAHISNGAGELVSVMEMSSVDLLNSLLGSASGPRGDPYPFSGNFSTNFQKKLDMERVFGYNPYRTHVLKYVM